MPNIALKIAYDGRPFLGWQKTNRGLSVEGELENALHTVLKEKIALQAASRTDAGVHAAGQIVNFLTRASLDLEQLKAELNQILCPFIAILEIYEAPLRFHPTLDCKGKHYRYSVDTGKAQFPHNRFYAWHFPCSPDVLLMRQAGAVLIGTHDFQSFCNIRKNMTYEDYIRTITNIEIVEEANNRLTVSIKGSNFLYRMVRNLVGTLMYVGIGKISVTDISSILAAKDRTKAGITAPAHGLTLMSIDYAS